MERLRSRIRYHNTCARALIGKKKQVAVLANTKRTGFRWVRFFLWQSPWRPFTSAGDICAHGAPKGSTALVSSWLCWRLDFAVWRQSDDRLLKLMSTPVPVCIQPRPSRRGQRGLNHRASVFHFLRSPVHQFSFRSLHIWLVSSM
jgi:hypothetical protein